MAREDGVVCGQLACGQLPGASGCTYLLRLSIKDVETNLGVGAPGGIWARRNARARACVPPTDGPRQRANGPHAATDGRPWCAGNATVYRDDDAGHGNGNARDARHAAHDDEHDGSEFLHHACFCGAAVCRSGMPRESNCCDTWACAHTSIVVAHARVHILLQVRG